MNPEEVFGGFLSGFFQYLQAKAITGKIGDVVAMVEAVNNWVGRALTAIADKDYQEIGAVKFSAQYATQIGKDFEQIEGYQQARWNRLLQVIMPNTLAHAVGYVFAAGIVPLRQSVASLDKSLIALGQQVSSIVDWEQRVAKPELADYVAFKQAFDTLYLPALNVLVDWLNHPADFGDWAAAPVTGPIIAYLADPAHKQSRDNLTEILAAGWEDRAEETWNDFADMLVGGP